MIVVHQNPDCGTSHNVLATIEAAGVTPILIDNLREGWSRSQLLGLFAAAGLTPRSALRETKSSWAPASRFTSKDTTWASSVSKRFRACRTTAPRSLGNYAHSEKIRNISNLIKQMC